MPAVEAYRPSVVARSGGACEYCRLMEAATGVTFHIEHVVPRVHGGSTILDNLALSCPGCNLAKGGRIRAQDGRGREQRLFNPRMFQSWLLGWHLHFILHLDSG
jgi:5-methylcytosine-specific restriction endonuclease McrA